MVPASSDVQSIITRTKTRQVNQLSRLLYYFMSTPLTDIMCRQKNTQDRNRFMEYICTFSCVWLNVVWISVYKQCRSYIGLQQHFTTIIITIWGISNYREILLKYLLTESETAWKAKEFIIPGKICNSFRRSGRVQDERGDCGSGHVQRLHGKILEKFFGVTKLTRRNHWFFPVFIVQSSIAH